MTLMSLTEFLLSAALGFLFWKKGLHRRFPAMGAYLALRVATSPILSALLFGQTGGLSSSQDFARTCGQVYYFLYWADYIVSAVLLYFICLEIFRSALTSLPGLLKFGVVIFRWAVLVSVIVTASSISFAHRGLMILPDIGIALMRSVSLLELCLLAFLCLSMNALKLSVRDLAFGLSLGFGLMSTNDFLFASLISRYASLTAPLQFGYEAVILFSLSTWVGYCALPGAGQLYNLPLERDRLGTGPHGHTGRRSAASEQLLPDGCGECGGEGAEQEPETAGVRILIPGLGINV